MQYNQQLLTNIHLILLIRFIYQILSCLKNETAE